MSTSWQIHLERWTAAGLIDEAAAIRVRDWESGQARPTGLRWPTIVALAMGALMLCGGVLLFVSAHWDAISPAARMAVVLLMVGVFHAGGAAAADRFAGLATALHTVGTVALGAAIALAGQIFNLNEHWPAAVLLWAIGAALAWAMLGHWTQGALTAILAPYWLAAEWTVSNQRVPGAFIPMAAGVCALSLTYLSARQSSDDSALRKALAWIGGIAVLPAAASVAIAGWIDLPKFTESWAGWAVAALLPVAVAVLLRGRQAVWNVAAVLWSFALALSSGGHDHRLLVYFWCAIGAAGLAAWGINEARAERINLGIAGFAITVLAFYFSTVMDKLGRSFSLTVLGLLFLGGGWLLERTRRRLIANLQTEAL